MPKNRVEAFTDAVIAIIMTILVLELRTPEDGTWQALFDSSHKLIIYVVSFVTLAIYWNNHHHLFHKIDNVNGYVLWVNNFLIFTLSLFPFATAWVGDHLWDLAPQVTFGVVILGANIAFYWLYWALFKINGAKKNVIIPRQDVRKMQYSCGGSMLAIILGILINPMCTLAINVVITLAWFIPDKRAETIHKDS